MGTLLCPHQHHYADVVLLAGWATPFLADEDTRCLASREFNDFRGDQFVMKDHIHRLQYAKDFHGQEFWIAGTCTSKICLLPRTPIQRDVLSG